MPAPLGFNLTMVLHLLLGGVGTYRFLRAERASRQAAVLGGMIFEAMPKIIAHLAAGHVTLVYAVAWTPWLLLSERSNQCRRGWQKYLLGPGLVLGLILLADVRWAAYAGMLWVVYGITNVRRFDTQLIDDKRRASVKRILSHTGRWFAWGVPQAILGLTLAASLLLPLAEFTRLSTRASLSPQDVFTYSLPPDRLIGILYPAFGAYAEWVTYFGAICLVFLIAALVLQSVWSRTRLWAVIFLVSLLYSLGSNLPTLEFLAAIPGFSLLRVPPRALLVGGFALSILVGLAADEIGKNQFARSDKRQLQPLLLPVTIFMFIAILTGGIFILTRSMPLNFVWGAVAISITCVWLGLRIKDRINASTWRNGLLLITALDLTGVNFFSIQAHSQPVDQL
ncbi:MAG: hypothetical protein PHQ40_13465, partial [Anaerolineaceae bacterium]|nr:hypothetical protein [Anaerolineaceae bacterium]